ncbi:MAG: GHKL domain-containing protein, partial [Deltaproteobacteria bacterium]
VTDTAQVERELERKNAELEHYVNAVSHDLRSPLSSIRGFAGLLRESLRDHEDEDSGRFIERIEASSRSMETLIEDLLELSRIGRERVRKSLVDPMQVLERLRAELKPRLDAQGVRLSLPATAPFVLCDQTQIYQIFANLVGNALDHMGECVDPQIAIDIREAPSWHQLIVRDNGRGIDPAEHERIFEIFQSLGSSGARRRCAGVGLAIVKKIAENHGGRVRVISRPGFGATFQVNLPRS